MKVWLKYIDYCYEDYFLDAVMTEEAMLKDKQSYYLEATVKLSEDIKYLTNKVEIAKKNDSLILNSIKNIVRERTN